MRPGLLALVGRDVTAQSFIVGRIALSPDLVTIRRWTPTLVVGLVVVWPPYYDSTHVVSYRRVRSGGGVTLRTCRVHASVLPLGSGT